MADAKVSEAAKKAARLNVRPDLGAGYFTDERETWAMGYVAGAAAERERTCEYSPISEGGYKSQCGRVRAKATVFGNLRCDNCGGKIVVAAQDRG